MKAFRFGDTLYHTRHGPPILARNILSLELLLCLSHLLSMIPRERNAACVDRCGRTEGEGEEWRTGGTERWDVCSVKHVILIMAKGVLWHPFVIHCMLRNNGTLQFGQSSITVIMRLDLCCYELSQLKNDPDLTRWELIFVENLLQPVLRINWMSCSWTLLHWDTEIFVHLMRPGERRCFMYLTQCLQIINLGM